MSAWQPVKKQPNHEKWQLLLYPAVFFGAFATLAVLVWIGQYLLSLAA